MPDLATHIPKLLGGTCKLYTTKCVSRELRSLGPEFAASAAAARAFPLHKCDHSHKHSKADAEDDEDDEEEKEEGGEGEGQPASGGSSGGCISAADCIRAAIGRHNEAHWFVATQDAALRRELGKVPGCPLVFATVNGVHLETPSEVTRQKAKEAEEASRSVGKHERAAEPLLRPDQLVALRKELRREGPGGGGVKGGMPPPTTSARFRRNKAKGPNPLAMKKKAKPKKGPMTGSAAEAAAAAAAEHQHQQGTGKSVKRKAAGQDRSADGAQPGGVKAQAGQADGSAAQKRRRKR